MNYRYLDEGESITPDCEIWGIGTPEWKPVPVDTQAGHLDVYNGRGAPVRKPDDGGGTYTHVDGTAVEGEGDELWCLHWMPVVIQCKDDDGFPVRRRRRVPPVRAQLQAKISSLHNGAVRAVQESYFYGRPDSLITASTHLVGTLYEIRDLADACVALTVEYARERSALEKGTE